MNKVDPFLQTPSIVDQTDHGQQENVDQLDEGNPGRSRPFTLLRTLIDLSLSSFPLHHLSMSPADIEYKSFVRPMSLETSSIQ